jgi:hypothetical protein
MQFFWILVSFALLMNAFLVDDFSVKYVASNSNTQLPDKGVKKFVKNQHPPAINPYWVTPPVAQQQSGLRLTQNVQFQAT